MKSVISFALAVFVATSNANPITLDPRSIPGPSYDIGPASNGSSFDVIIIGGGPAGLSALSGLARVRRNALLIDSAEYRNAETRHLHDMIGYDHTVPAAFRAAAREGISKYPTATMQNGTVVSITSPDNGTTFITTDSNGQIYTSKKVVLATGLRDILPDTPGIKEAWSRGIYWCPWCDGYEHRDQRFGILGSILDVVGTVFEVITLNKDIIAFVNGTWTPENVEILNTKRPGWQQQLSSTGYNIQIINTTITSITRIQDGALVNDPNTDSEFDRFNVNLEGGSFIERDVFMTNFPSKQRSYLGTEIGVQVYGEKMIIDPASMRAATGVWAVGDANSDNSTNVPHALYTGKKAAVVIHVELEREFAEGYVTKRDGEEEEVMGVMGRDLEDLWEGMVRG
ncbi:FAD/NAD(P)-binding protein [Glarea lozoyensis ATCC 20868]|uniref:FAD/NAD(P)-binding protein n=1 Tax=Glarea lozoyensis (strain ATCC 20868 / MF5171) TaxID=1116229 RepID=S3D2G2_GLAL2|nr:FAD/NAD(P)-binding protein [Glarea lozoyensis ATCC 20868]EPE32015.1 FAD/NAD(P)-binding protein [Glarea lozoyensis ATCC 20868]